MTSKKRKWSENYQNFGFTCVVDKDGLQRPQCIICSAMFSNASLRLCKLRDHFENKHGGEASHSTDNLKIKRARFDISGTLTAKGFVIPSKPLLLASYKVA